VSKQTLLLVDGDARSLRVLEVSLRKAGFSVTTAENVRDAMEKLAVRVPELIISEVRFDDGDGFDLRRKVHAQPEWQDIPFVFLTVETAIEYKIKGLELGVDDYLTKPIYIKEIVARIGILLQKKQRIRLEERKDLRTRFVGRLSDMPVIDVIQTVEISRKSGVIQFVGEREQLAAIYFRDGKIIDAEAGPLQGEDAVYRLLTWNEGDFEVVFRVVRRREVITVSSQGLLMEGMRRLDEWTLLLEQLPSLRAKFEVDTDELVARLGDIPDDNNRILRLIDGKRSLLEIIDACDVGDLECLQVISRLYFEGLLLDISGATDSGSHRRRSAKFRAASAPVVEDAAAESNSDKVVSQPVVDEVVQDEAIISILADEATGSLAHAAPSQDSTPTAEPEPGPLLGGYRKSSLRLIDEAVAAAQAIDPGFSIDDADAQQWWSTRPPLSTDLIEAAQITPNAETIETSAPATVAKLALVKSPRATRDVSSAAAAAIQTAGAALDSDEATNAVPSEMADADQTSSPRSGAMSVVAPQQSGVVEELSTTSRTETSAMRMISSLGRETAQVAGELADSGEGAQPDNTARQMVTILPRRTTREIPDAAVAQLNAVAQAAVEPPSDQDVKQPENQASSDDNAALPVAARIAALPGAGGTTTHSGNGKAIALLLGIAAVLFAAAIYVTCNKSKTKKAQAPAIAMDGNVVIVPDASVAMSSIDARSAVADAIALAPDADISTDAAPSKRHRELIGKAKAALDEGDAETALRFALESIAEKPTASAYVVKADALRRQSKTDDALAAVNVAIRMGSDYAAAWEMKGRILWNAKRSTEALEAFATYLKLEPKGARADGVRMLIGQ
jgi:CheY-like chemotaxis protein